MRKDWRKGVREGRSEMELTFRGREERRRARCWWCDWDVELLRSHGKPRKLAKRR